MANPIRVGGVAAGSISGAAEFQAFLRGYPDQVIRETRQAVDAGADQMVAEIKAAAPVSALETRPGQLRESVHKEDGRHDLSVLIVEDAQDAKGHGFAPHVEYGHKAPDGSHVAAEPHFWPTVRAGKRRIAAAIRAAMRKAAKAAPP